MRLRPVAVSLLLLSASATAARALEIRVSAQALERTLNAQLFNGEEHRFYIRGNSRSSCFVYATDPKVSFRDDRVVVHLKTRSRLGQALGGACLGVALSPEADVSVVPQAEGETIGFRDARVEQLSASRELNFLLVPFLSRKLPQQMKINAAELLVQLLAKSTDATGYDIRLDTLKIHSMQVSGDALVVDLDGQVSVH